jgi:hypothetical protein
MYNLLRTLPLARSIRLALSMAVSFTESEKGLLTDPNYGVALYNSRSALCSDLHSLICIVRRRQRLCNLRLPNAI